MTYKLDELGEGYITFFSIFKGTLKDVEKEAYVIANLTTGTIGRKTYSSEEDALRALKNHQNIKGILTNYRNECGIYDTLDKFINVCRELQCQTKGSNDYNNLIRYIAHDLGICKFNKKMNINQTDETIIAAKHIAKIIYINNNI
jgi:hypothetical protein